MSGKENKTFPGVGSGELGRIHVKFKTKTPSEKVGRNQQELTTNEDCLGRRYANLTDIL